MASVLECPWKRKKGGKRRKARKRAIKRGVPDESEKKTSGAYDRLEDQKEGERGGLGHTQETKEKVPTSNLDARGTGRVFRGGEGKRNAKKK